MKKVILILIIFLAFVLGMKASDTGTSTSKLLEEEKIKFEEEITQPGNTYEPKTYVPDENIINKTAHQIDKTIDKMIQKIKDIVKKM